MKRKTIRRVALLAGGLSLCLATLLFIPRSVDEVAAQAPAGCIQFAAPQTTHGFVTSAGLPNGDQFLLGTNLDFTVVTPDATGAMKFTVNNTTFGGTPGFPGTTLEGLTASTPNAKVTALSCLDDFWDINFYLATKGTTNGDMVRLFLQKDLNASQVIELAKFNIIPGNAQLASLNSNVTLHLNDRLARGQQAVIPGVNDVIPFIVPAGTAGNRTQLLTLAFSMLPNAATMGCWHFGFEIIRGGGQGMTSVVINDVVVNRNTLPGDQARPGTGLLGGLTGGFPTGRKCNVVCAPCPPVSGGGGGPAKCHTVCFQSPAYFQLKFECLSANTFLCGFNVIVPGVNFNRPVNVCRADDQILHALRGGAVFGNQPRNAYWLFVQQYVALQLGLELSASGPAKFDALWGGLSCYNLPPGTLPVALSNGVTIDQFSMTKDLFMQAEAALRDGRIADMEKLGRLFAAFNGNAYGYSTCNSAGQFK